jgi:hypothetical protein
VPSSSNFPASHLDSEPGLIAQSYRPFSSSPLGGPTQVARRKLRPSSAAVATSREGHRFSHEDRPQLSVALRMLRLRTIYRAENIVNVLKRVVNVCQQEFVNEVLGPLVTELICNFGRENARPIQHAFHGGLLDPM